MLALLPYLIAAVIGAGLVGGIVGKVKGWQISGLEADVKTLTADVKQLEGEKAGWKLASERCSASIIQARNDAEARDKAARATIAMVKAQAAKREERLAELALEASSPPAEATCESAVISVTERL